MHVKQEPEDDFMSDYLNADYLTTDIPLSPPNSTASLSTDGCSPKKQEGCDFLLDMSQSDLLNEWMIPPLVIPDLNLMPMFLPETPKKKRGRKKREVVPVMQIAQPSPLAPKPPAPCAQTKLEPETQREEMELAKRQERLIKNRAAALLSRKRKREHVTSLEEENQKLHDKVNGLETKVQELAKENNELKQKLNLKPASKAATGIVFMILFFSFALFTLPSNSDRLTVGGSRLKQLPLIGSGYVVTPSCKHGNCSENTDLVLIDSVRPRDLQTWINHSLQKESHQSHLYLYSNEFSQLATQSNTQKGKPMLSLVSPYNQTSDLCDRYLQIDVQVLGSKVIQGHITSLQQHDSPSSLLKEMKKDLITYPRMKKNQEENRSISTSRVVSQ